MYCNKCKSNQIGLNKIKSKPLDYPKDVAKSYCWT